MNTNIRTADSSSPVPFTRRWIAPGIALCVALLCNVAIAQQAAKPTFSDVVKASAPADWRPLDPQRMLYLELASGRVVIELHPVLAPNHVANIVALAEEGWFDGGAIIRSQDNYVAQWGDPDEKSPRPLKSAALFREHGRQVAALCWRGATSGRPARVRTCRSNWDWSQASTV